MVVIPSRRRRARRKALPPGLRGLRRRERLFVVGVVAIVAALAAIFRLEPKAPPVPGGDIDRYHDKTFRVVHVVDGDTLDIDISDGSEPKTRIRLWGVDTPEVAHGGQAADHFGDEARKFARDTLDGRDVHVVLWDKDTRDRYERLLAYVLLERGGPMFNEMLIDEGLAYADTRFKHPHDDQFEAAERRARREGRGLWRDIAPDKMPEWRQRVESSNRGG